MAGNWSRLTYILPTQLCEDILSDISVHLPRIILSHTMARIVCVSRLHICLVTDIDLITEGSLAYFATNRRMFITIRCMFCYPF